MPFRIPQAPVVHRMGAPQTKQAPQPDQGQPTQATPPQPAPQGAPPGTRDRRTAASAPTTEIRRQPTAGLPATQDTLTAAGGAGRHRGTVCPGRLPAHRQREAAHPPQLANAATHGSRSHPAPGQRTHRPSGDHPRFLALPRRRRGPRRLRPLRHPTPTRSRLPQPAPGRPTPLLPTAARDRFAAHRTLIPPRGRIRHIGGRPLHPLIRRHVERPERPQPPEGRIPESATPGSLPSPVGAAEKLQSTSRRQRLLLLR